jgi:predicted outer membrane repeat protein
VVTVSQTEVDNNVVLIGGGISVYGGSKAFTLDLRFSRVTDNYAEDNGGGLYVYEGARVDLDHVAFIYNHAGMSGGGIYAQETFGSSWSDVTVAENTAEIGDGGGLFLYSRNIRAKVLARPVGRRLREAVHRRWPRRRSPTQHEAPDRHRLGRGTTSHDPPSGRGRRSCHNCHRGSI